ncbi:MAG TPA: helix-turn-helix transcriptional regulator [Ktedonobacteraceae bacterium]|nr:helix-turn-helix transcriptional regulator [Ktedonobacteraceae bacterium]
MNEKYTKGRRSRGRMADNTPLTKIKKPEQPRYSARNWDSQIPEDTPDSSEDKITDVPDNFLSPNGHAGAFSVLLGFLIKNDRSEILRLAREIGVSDNTVYRWLNGSTEPRPSHMRRLLEVLSPMPPTHSLAPRQISAHDSGHTSGTYAGRWDVQKEIFHRVLEQAATTVDNASRRWHITETIFQYALLHLDPDCHGLALTYARLMPPRADGTIHSLCEVEMRGQSPWAFALDYKTYLGSTTLAGSAALLQRVKVWSAKDEDARIPVGLDKNERSSCAAPVMRGGRVAGVLIVSSALADFVRNPTIPAAVSDYANLMATGLQDCDFYPTEQIKLVPMPELDWQRQQIASTYLNRVIECARKDGLSYPEAEQKVLQNLEEEFERYACGQDNKQVSPQFIEIEQSH